MRRLGDRIGIPWLAFGLTRWHLLWKKVTRFSDLYDLQIIE